MYETVEKLAAMDALTGLCYNVALCMLLYRGWKALNHALPAFRTHVIYRLFGWCIDVSTYSDTWTGAGMNMQYDIVQ